MAAGGEDLCHTVGNFVCYTTFHMFSGVRNPFLVLFFRFKVVFKVKNPFQGQFIKKLKYNKLTARRNKKAYEKHRQQTAIRHQNRYALNPIWPPSTGKDVFSATSFRSKFTQKTPFLRFNGMRNPFLKLVF